MSHPRTIRQTAWTPFVPCQTLDGGRSQVLMNSLYTVIRTVEDAEPGAQGAQGVVLSIRRNDRQAAHDWRHFQRIKNELVGPECEGVEMYPAESRLVDTANQYFIWCSTDPTYRFPLGFRTRLVADGTGGTGKARQRNWAAGERPADALSHGDLEWIVDRLSTARSGGQSQTPEGEQR